jgi:hypothetical protein
VATTGIQVDQVNRCRHRRGRGASPASCSPLCVTGS